MPDLHGFLQRLYLATVSRQGEAVVVLRVLIGLGGGRPRNLLTALVAFDGSAGMPEARHSVEHGMP